MFPPGDTGGSLLLRLTLLSRRATGQRWATQHNRQLPAIRASEREGATGPSARFPFPLHAHGSNVVERWLHGGVQQDIRRGVFRSVRTSWRPSMRGVVSTTKNRRPLLRAASPKIDLDRVQPGN